MAMVKAGMVKKSVVVPTAAPNRISDTVPITTITMTTTIATTALEQQLVPTLVTTTMAAAKTTPSEVKQGFLAALIGEEAAAAAIAVARAEVDAEQRTRSQQLSEDSKAKLDRVLQASKTAVECAEQALQPTLGRDFQAELALVEDQNRKKPLIIVHTLPNEISICAAALVGLFVGVGLVLAVTHTFPDATDTDTAASTGCRLICTALRFRRRFSIKNQELFIDMHC